MYENINVDTVSPEIGAYGDRNLFSERKVLVRQERFEKVYDFLTKDIPYVIKKKLKCFVEIF